MIMAKRNIRIQTKVLVAALTVASVLCVPVLGNAETVQVPVGQQAKQKWTMDRPISGMKQSQVEAIFGQPLDWREAVGDPPISSWIYPEFVVYFEYDHVLHSVLKQSQQPVATTRRQEQGSEE